jgi:rod shape-determining protein MreC
MFSRRTVIIGLLVALITINIILLSVTSKYSSFGPGRIAIPLIGPIQQSVSYSVRFVKGIWSHYFFLISAAKENESLKKALSQEKKKNNQLKEVELSNKRLRSLLNFQKTMAHRVLAAEVIGEDPSPWFKAVTIDKGSADGVAKGLPVVVSEGIAGLVTDVTYRYAKVLLIIDQNSAVDALIQQSRARGIIKGGFSNQCFLKNVLRKYDIDIGDVVVSSGLDGVFPKGLRIGYISSVAKQKAGIFQEITVKPYIDFEELEEVLVLLGPPTHEAEKRQ